MKGIHCTEEITFGFHVLISYRRTAGTGGKEMTAQPNARGVMSLNHQRNFVLMNGKNELHKITSDSGLALDMKRSGASVYLLGMSIIVFPCDEPPHLILTF